MTRTMYDAAYPNFAKLPSDANIVAGYIGGNTPHVWSDAEWNAVPSHVDWLLPIWVRSNPVGDIAATDATAALSRVKALGMPVGGAIALDLETAVSASYVHTFDSVVHGAGYLTVTYGSVSSLPLNGPVSGGWWTAHWTDVPHIEPGSVATQWADATQIGAPWDVSMVNDALPLWPIHSWAPKPTPGPHVNRYAGFPTLSAAWSPNDPRSCSGLANIHCPVTSLQNALNIISGHESPSDPLHLVPDGIFGPVTKADVINFQRFFGLTVDGVVGPNTWAALDVFLTLKGR